MSVKKLSNEVQSLFSSSINLTSYKKVVEELVYNSLDAKATSIAIRIHIEQNKIQVVDNGCGIGEQDFKLIGERNATSKYVDIFNFKSAPNTYGFQGQALASIVEISKYVKITSRLENQEVTWSKIYHRGKQKNIIKTTNRPSKGTTVEINGFLYNLNIQSKLVNKTEEINVLKNFLKQLSLVHNNVSLSLRDDNKNEIIFKMHKYRDLYQILKLLFNIDKSSVQELKVEKNEYKAFALIGKSYHICYPHHWIFLNKRFVNNCKLHKLIIKNFSKYYYSKNKKVRSKNSEGMEDFGLVKDCIPFYIIFLTCPYYDYHVSNTSKQSIVEFKEWNSISKLIEKLINFYAGDFKFKEMKANCINKSNLTQSTDTRDQVRKIMNKILNSNSKKVGVSQTRNGIKGKLIKRKKQKTSNNFKDRKNGPSDDSNDKHNKFSSKINSCHIKTVKKSKNNIGKSIKSKQPKNSEIYKNTKNTLTINLNDNIPQINQEISTISKLSMNQNVNHNKYLRMKIRTSNSIRKNCNKNSDKKIETYTYNLIDAETDAETKVYDNKIVKYGYIQENDKNVSVRKRFGETGTNKIIPPPKKCRPTNSYMEKKKDSECIFYKSYDLVKTILGTQKDVQCFTPNVTYPIFNNFSSRNYPITSKHNKDDKIFPTITFQSHHYNFNSARIANNNALNGGNINLEKNNNSFISNQKSNVNLEEKSKRCNFISERSKDIFAIPKVRLSSLLTSKNRRNATYSNYFNPKNIDACKWTELYDIRDTSTHSIDTPQSVGSITHYHQNKSFSLSPDQNIKQIDGNHKINSRNITLRYTITSSNITVNNNLSGHNQCYQSGKWKNILNSFSIDNLNPRNVVFVSNFQNTNTQLEEQNILIDKTNNVNILHKDNEISLIQKILNDPCVLNTLQTNSFAKSYQMLSHGDNIAEISCREVNQECADAQADIINIFTKSTDSIDDKNLTSNIDPLNVCQTIINNCSKVNDDASLFDKSLDPFGEQTQNKQAKANNNISFAFQNVIDENTINKELSPKSAQNNKVDIIVSNDNHNDDSIKQSYYFNPEQLHSNVQDKVFTGRNTFNMQTRFNFIPKGMSPIFKNCNSKNIIDKTQCAKRYFKNELYDNFITDVHTNTEIYEAKVQNTKDATTKAVNKVNSRLDKDNSSLTFNKNSLEEATVLGQVDNKFIATTMKGKSDNGNYLVLFDQHAVHERIRLETNLSEYIKDNKWVSIKLDDLILKLTEEEVLYLHNYKEKFTHFGLDWTVLNQDEIKIYSVPAAIIGQNSREVDKIILAVKKLITEGINNIVSQKGCLTLYPKAIMDLVFNEACRYAIKFGDILSKKESMDLIASLSTCKMPFQCAHGRPVMAIIMDVKSESRKYQINPTKLKQYKIKL